MQCPAAAVQCKGCRQMEAAAVVTAAPAAGAPAIDAALSAGSVELVELPAVGY